MCDETSFQLVEWPMQMARKKTLRNILEILSGGNDEDQQNDTEMEAHILYKKQRFGRILIWQW